MEPRDRALSAERARTKIVATVGPACSSEPMLRELLLAGADVFRLNLAHGSLEEHEKAIFAIREAANACGQPVGLLVDLAGPKIRLGELAAEVVECRLGDEFRFVRGDAASQPNELVTSYSTLVDELETGDRVMLADGTVGLEVLRRDRDAALCRVTQPGTIRSRQGVNLPGVKLRTPALTPTDEEHVAWAARMEADFVGLSFVRSPSDVQHLKSRLAAEGSRARAIAKIEKQEALDHLEAIVRVADGIMIARGDLGVEIDVARVPLVQKQIVALCARYRKPVITATQMLDSMQQSAQPTRAEASDVANAVIDGTDACMLSAETAVGKYPRQAVQTMNHIAYVTESRLSAVVATQAATERMEGLHPVTEAVVEGASLMARRLDARLIVVASHSGATALALSKQRNFVPTLGISDSKSTLRQMCLYWGVTPLEGISEENVERTITHVQRWGREQNLLSPGQRLVLVSGTHTRVSGHNQILVHEVADPGR